MHMRTSVVLVLVFLTVTGSLKAQQARQAPVIVFEGNRIFSQQELLGVLGKCLTEVSDWHDHSEMLGYCLPRAKMFMNCRGYLRAVIGEAKREEKDGGVRFVVPIKEGPLYRLGQITIINSRLFSPSQILEMLKLKTGDIASGEAIGEWLFQGVSKAYANFGYIQFTAEPEPDFYPTSDEAQEGVVDFKVYIEEGPAFTVRRIKFEGNGNVPQSTLRREIMLRNGDVFSRAKFNESLKTIDQMGIFDQIDSDKDVDYRDDNEGPLLDIKIRLKKKP